MSVLFISQIFRSPMSFFSMLPFQLTFSSIPETQFSDWPPHVGRLLYLDIPGNKRERAPNIPLVVGFSQGV